MPITWEEMQGEASPSEVKPTDLFGKKPSIMVSRDSVAGISLEDMGLSQQTKSETTADQGFFRRSGQAIYDFEEGSANHPLQNLKGVAKGLAAGGLELGHLAAKGISALAMSATQAWSRSGANLNKAGSASNTVDVPGNMEMSSEAVDQFLEADKQFSKGILYINLAPVNKQEEAFQRLLGIIPDAIVSTGDTIFERTGNALAATGAQALLTLLTMKPSLAGKVLKGPLKVAKGEAISSGGKKGAAKVQAAFDELAVKDPEAATALAEHVIEADPDVGMHLMKSIDDAGKWLPEELGKKLAEKSKEIGVSETGEVQVQTGTIPPSEGLSRATREFAEALTAEGRETPLVEKGIVAREVLRRQANEAQIRELKAQEREYIRSQITHEKDELGIHTVRSPNGETRAIVSSRIGTGGKEGQVTLKIQQTSTLASAKGSGEGTLRVERMFDEAQKMGIKLTSDVTVSAEQQRVYESLKKRGYKVKENPNTINPTTGGKISTDPRVPVYEVTKPIKPWNTRGAKFRLPDPILYMDAGHPVTRSSVERAFRTTQQAANLPGIRLVTGKLDEYYRQLIHTVNPEALGPEAKTGASILAKHIAKEMQKDSSQFHKAGERISFWNHRTPAELMDFITKFESGHKFSDPLLNKAAEAYRRWNEEIYTQEAKIGFTYEPIDNYLFHVFENSPGVAAFFTKRFGPKWNNPSFIKDRTFDLYAEAIKAGFKPKFTNPEEIMLARQHASNIAEMRVGALEEMKLAGLAKDVEKGGKGRPEDWPATEWRSPTGKRYWVHDSASAVLHNAFNTQSLWNLKGIVGDTFRSAMFLKNTIVPIKLALSLFHPLHVLTIDNATGMVRASKELLSGTKSPGRFLADMAGATLYTDIISNPRSGYRLLNVYKGKLPEKLITASDTQSLQYMAEGGFIPEMSSQYRIGAIAKFKSAIDRRSLSAAWHLPFAAIESLQRPMFEVWIPSLKIASYLKDVKTALTTDPTLLDNPIKRQLAFRRLSKSVDNRYGEMAYNTLFWNRWVKDLAVANTLSLGWQMGFIREYGGGMMDLGHVVTKEGSVVQKVKSGMLDRPLFVAFYTTQALAYGGLMTWALSNKFPQSLQDYIYPQTGETQPNGRPERVNTMFYPREFASIYKHMENEGVVSGLGHLAASKASGVLGMTREWATGVNSFDQEIRDPDAPAYKQIQQTLAATLIDLEPISTGTARESISENKGKAISLAVAGFSPAPKYVTETKTESLIKGTFRKYFSQRQTPFEKAQFSADRRELKKAFDSGDGDAYGEILNRMLDKFQLTGKEQRKLESSIAHSEDPLFDMYKRLTWQQQKKILDQMTDDERETFLPLSNKEHLRFAYEPPEKSK